MISEMSQIIRIMKPEMLEICRFCISHRNMHSHYETLRIPIDASQKDIRQAFLKLSKEMHPDINKNINHMDFVRVNEAYQVLSKMHTKQQYDMELHSRKTNGRSTRVVYYDGTSTERYPRPGPISNDPKDYSDTYYYVKGVRRVSNMTIAIVCIVVSVIGLSVQVLAVNKSFVLRKDMLLSESVIMQDAYTKVRTKAAIGDQSEQITELEKRLNLKDNNTEVKVDR